MAHHLAHGNSNYGEFRDVRYTYDELNRLIKVDDKKQDVFDEMFTYDDQGRITAQRRGDKVKENVGGEYSYYSKQNRLKSVAQGMGGTADSRNMEADNNFVYDSEGNLVEDKSKRLKIFYDWRGMPIEFIQQPQPTGSSSDTLFKLTMAYDGSGRRISKTSMCKVAGAADWDTTQVTHYTGIGTEIRENYHNESLEKANVVVKSLQGESRKNKLACSYDRTAAADAGGVNMPQGLGRYGIEDAGSTDNGSGTGDIPNAKFEWYLKNHLGSTMLVYGTQADANPSHSDIGTPLSAYDYRAFGEMIELTPSPTGKVTENFTGKEHDDEIALNYFGARYLDPMLGLWISVDPKRQFASPYLYVGNGYNPVSGVDFDGNYVIREFNAYNPAFRYGYKYHSYVEHVIEWIAGFAILESGIVACMPPKGEIENSLRSSKVEGAVAIAFDLATLGIAKLAKVASWVVPTFKFAKVPKLGYDIKQTLKQHPLLENYMHNLTNGELLYSSNLEDLERKAEWATSYGLNLYKQNVEITDEVRAKFNADFQAEFSNGAKDDNQ